MFVSPRATPTARGPAAELARRARLANGCAMVPVSQRLPLATVIIPTEASRPRAARQREEDAQADNIYATTTV